MDQTINPAYPFDGVGAELVANDPTDLVVNVAVTDEVQAAEADLPGAGAVHSACPRRRTRTPGSWLCAGSSTGCLGCRAWVPRADLGVLDDDGSIQAWADQEYGEGLVRVSSVLRPGRRLIGAG